MSRDIRATPVLLLAALLLVSIPTAVARPGDGAITLPQEMGIIGAHTLTSDQMAIALGGDSPLANLTATSVNVTVSAVTYEVTRNPQSMTSRSDVRVDEFYFDDAVLRLGPTEAASLVFLWGKGIAGSFEATAGSLGAVDQKTVVPPPFWVQSASEPATSHDPVLFIYRIDREIEEIAPGGFARLQGDTGLYLRNATLEIQTSAGAVTLRSGATRTDPVPGVVEVHRFTYYILQLRESTVTLGTPDRVAVYAPAPLVEITGAIQAPVARGEIRVNDAVYPVDEVPLRIEGTLTIRPVLPAGADTLGDAADRKVTSQRPGYTSYETRLQGDITAISVAARRVDLPDSSSAVPVAVTGGAALVVLLTYFAPLLRYELTAALLPLYHRIREPEVLNNEVRNSLYGIIKSTPGISARALHRASGQSWGTVVYHLRQLERHHLVKSKQMGRSKNFYENHGKYHGMEREIAVLHADKSVLLAQAICQAPGVSQEALTAQTGLPQSTISYYVRKLKDAALIEERRVGKYATYYPRDTLPAALLIVNTPAIPAKGAS